MKTETKESDSAKKFASVFGSPGARVRFVGFARIFWPYMLVVFILGWLAHCAWPVKVPPFPLATAVVALLLSAVAAFGAAERRFESYLKGAKGEEITARELSLLETGWDVFHGISTSDGSDFDHIVVGPDAIFLIETKNWSGMVRIENGVLRLNGATVSRSPVAQARRGARDLARLLEQALPAGFEIAKIVCFASNNLEGEEARIDDVLFCNVRGLRSVIMESPPQPLDAPRRQLVAETLARKTM